MSCIHSRLILAIFLLSAPAARASWFIRGDVDGSGGRNIADVIGVLGHLFHADQTSLRCLDAADVDDDGKIEITDAIDLLQYLFLGSPAPWPEPLLQGCGYDNGPPLGCEESAACSSLGRFYVCDKSGSMSEGARLQKLQREVIAGISQLSEGDQFAIIFFDTLISKYPFSGEPANATEQAKSEAFGYVMSNTTGHGTCATPALIAALNWAAESNVRAKEIVFITDGVMLCPGFNGDEAAYARLLLDEVAAKNQGAVAISVLGVGSSVNEGWLRDLAVQNGGSYATIPE